MPNFCLLADFLDEKAEIGNSWKIQVYVTIHFIPLDRGMRLDNVSPGHLVQKLIVFFPELVEQRPTYPRPSPRLEASYWASQMWRVSSLGPWPMSSTAWVDVVSISPALWHSTWVRRETVFGSTAPDLAGWGVQAVGFGPQSNPTMWSTPWTPKEYTL